MADDHDAFLLLFGSRASRDEESTQAIRRITGGPLGKRQVEQLAARAAVDFEAFYSQPTRSQATVTEGE